MSRLYKAQIFILHHKPAYDRKVSLLNTLDTLDLPYNVEWIDKFLPGEISLSNLNIKLSELSLTLKHQYALQKILENNIDFGIVFEDDVNLESIQNISSFLRQSIDEINEYKGDILWIGDVWVGKYTIPKDKKTPDKLAYFDKNCYSRCTHAYIVSNNGAKKILEKYSYDQPVDHMFNKLISDNIILTGWTEPGLIQKSAEGLCPSLI